MSERMPRQLQTTNLIDHACIHLLKTTNFNQLTIKMILHQAGIARGTFYHYYSDKYALLDHIEDQLINQIAFIFTAINMTAIILHPSMKSSTISISIAKSS